MLKIVFLDIDGIFYDYETKTYIPKELVEEALKPFKEKKFNFYWITYRNAIIREIIADKYDLDLWFNSEVSPETFGEDKIDFFFRILRSKWGETMSYDQMVLRTNFYIFDDVYEYYLRPSWTYLSDIRAIRKIYKRIRPSLHPNFGSNKKGDLFYLTKWFLKTLCLTERE